MLALDALGRLALGQAPAAAANAVTASVGTFTFTGVDAVFSVTMPAVVGTYTYTGIAAGLVVSMPAGVGAFTLTGQTALTTSSYTLTASPFSSLQETQFGFAPLGAVALGQGFVDSSTSVSFEVVGADLSFAYSMAAGVGAFTFTGQTILGFQGNILSPDTGALTVAFPEFGTAIVLPLAAGALAITGQSTTDLALQAPKIRRFPRVGAGAISARSRGGGMRARAYGG